MNKRFYITTAIDYVNGQPHLGHAYEKVIADVIARARRSLGQDVFFLTGLDEHGQKVQQAAQAEGKDPQTYCDQLAQDWKAFAARLGLTNDDFVRTTDARHKQIVQASLSDVDDGSIAPGLTALCTLSAFLYNMAAALLGGIDITLVEDEH